MVQTVFQRHEKKYVLSSEQYRMLTTRLGQHLEPDEYGGYGIANLYFDTDSYYYAQASTGRRPYKEKLRLRAYGRVSAETQVFLELKKKYKGVTYKRRAHLSYSEAKSFLKTPHNPSTQILREIAYVLNQRPLTAKVFLCYNRLALTGQPDLRVTFDTDIRFRLSDLRLDAGAWGTDILPDKILMEVKTPTAIPLWLSRALSDCEAFPASFSKYGTCCREFIFGNVNRRDSQCQAY
ncbi:MAG: polyphosphate polymerase domain-containing protein [Clostridiales bacterium]|jgi:SPX domain protein involved in polyphosphate accumulation|nr:polyphosphate polymerase domain-containing protein [Clostridiales bacterium]